MMNAKTIIISSQRYLDAEILAAKREDNDYDVMLSPVFTIFGIDYQVVLDGNHSLAAAKADGVAPVYREATDQDSDALALLGSSVEDFLRATYMDSSYYNVETGNDIW